MKDFSNSAKRVLNLVLVVHSKPDQPSTASTWAEAFGLDPDESKSDPHEVNQKLSLLRHELDHLERQMAETHFSEKLYKPYIQRVRLTVSPSNISAGWGSYKNNLSPDVILALRYCSEILSSEPNADFEELERLLSELQTFKDSLDSSSINPATYRFVMSQIGIIEQAIRSYPIAGGEALRKAFTEGFSDLTSRASELADQEETEVTSRVGQYWQEFKKAGEEFVSADRIANAYIGIIEKGTSLAKNVLEYLPPPS